MYIYIYIYIYILSRSMGSSVATFFFGRSRLCAVSVRMSERLCITQLPRGTPQRKNVKSQYWRAAECGEGGRERGSLTHRRVRINGPLCNDMKLQAQECQDPWGPVWRPFLFGRSRLCAVSVRMSERLCITQLPRGTPKYFIR